VTAIFKEVIIVAVNLGIRMIMAVVNVNVPDGEQCKNCRFQQQGTVIA
jgi:hypothetical protein